MEREKLNQLKEKHGQNALFLFRAGDFYELYYDDAETASKLLGITLTRRFDGTPQAMFPHYALDTYLPKMVRAGHRVAICDQLAEK
jgi:DNA mismatch repair protein MutS